MPGGLMRVTIHGSCVSRDAFELIDPAQATLTRYIARQSLISAGTACPPLFDPADRLDSPFQIRMLSGDLRGDALEHITGVAAETDLLVCDLTDERLGVFALPDGSYLTRTVEGLAQHVYPAGLRLIELGEDEHFRLFEHALDRWATAVADAGLLDRVVVLHVPWASQTVDGEATPASFKLSADLANVVYSRYLYAMFDRVDPWVIRPRVRVAAQGDHQWGPAPFHYVPEVQRDLADQIVELGRRIGPRD